MHALLTKVRAHEAWVLLLLALGGLALRLWALDAKGLAYDEAATALMARASAAEILQFHWTAAFEHPPLWQLTMRTWSALFGQSEAALRLLPALAGAASVPLAWYWLRLLWPEMVGLRLIAAGLIGVSPALVLYAQEARMYTIVVLLALLSLIALVDLVQRPGWAAAALFVAINWLLVGYHYYALLLVGCEWLFLLLVTVRSGGIAPGDWRRARWWDAACLASVVPIALWMIFSPGFRDTFAVVTQGIGSGATPAAFFDGIWRDLSFGAFRWQPEIAAWGYLLAPLVALGAWAVVAGGGLARAGGPEMRPGGRPARGVRATRENRGVRGQQESGGAQGKQEDGGVRGQQESGGAQGKQVDGGVRSKQRAGGGPGKQGGAAAGGLPWGWLLVLVGLLPLLLSVVLFRTLAARYVLFILPAMYALAAAGVVWLGRRHWGWGAAGLLLALVPAVLGLGHYFGGYQKSEYREMATYLRAHLAPDEAIMLYAPRQHLLAKYYLGADRTYATAPQVELPEFWPVNAPPVVPEEMDGQIQELLAAHPAVWLSMTAQDEVDDGEFVPKYLTAIAYKQDCRKWIDVELCRFVSPASVEPTMTITPDILYNGELRLARAGAALVNQPTQGAEASATIYAQLDWVAKQKPAVDYRVTLRLLDAEGKVVAQRDEFPIGPLLPPATWNAGDAKPGYMALPLPRDLPGGEYTLTVDVYEPDTGATFAPPVEVAAFAIGQ